MPQASEPCAQRLEEGEAETHSPPTRKRAKLQDRPRRRAIDYRPTTQEAITLLQSLPVRSDSTICLVNGTYTVREATAQHGDLSHCMTRIEVIEAVEWNCKAAVWELSGLAEVTRSRQAGLLAIGHAAFRLWKQYHAKRVALLKEFELVTAAQKVMRQRGEGRRTVKNTSLLLRTIGAGVSPHEANLTPNQEDMLAYARTYHGQPITPDPVPTVPQESAKQKAMAAYITHYQLTQCDALLAAPAGASLPVRFKGTRWCTPERKRKVHKPRSFRQKAMREYMEKYEAGSELRPTRREVEEQLGSKGEKGGGDAGTGSIFGDGRVTH